MAQSWVLHVHIDGALISQEGGLPFGFVTDQNAHDQWFREQVNQALSGPQEKPSLTSRLWMRPNG